MAEKENKGGLLTNEQVEQDLAAKGRPVDGGNGYAGSQDNGDSLVRQTGNEVQKSDGRPADGQSGE